MELPEDFGARDMFDVFKEHGLVDEVVKPPRRDREGRRYGFVRFRKVCDEKLLAVQLDNIFIKSKKLHANIPRFQRPLMMNERIQNNGGSNRSMGDLK